MKILLINCVHKNGSTGKIVYDIYNGLIADGHEAVICYGRGPKSHDKNVYKCCTELYAKLNNLFSRFTGIMYGGCAISTWVLFRIILRENPDVVHVHCINGYFVNIYRLVDFLKKRRIKTVITLHAEFMHTANCSHAFDCEKWKTGCGKCPRLKKETKSLFLDNTALSWKKMKKSFEGFNELVVTSVSPWLQERAESSPILAGKRHLTVYNGLDTSVFRFSPNQFLKSQLGLENKRIVFHATAAFSMDKNHIKGGFYVVELAKLFWETDRNVVFVIAGSHESLCDIPPNIIFLGKITDQKKLAQWYSVSDVTLLTSKKETFSMVVAESLCCGTPVVGFESGAPERISIKEYSKFIPYGNLKMLSDSVNRFLNAEFFDKEVISTRSKEKYGSDKMIQEYVAIYEEFLK